MYVGSNRDSDLDALNVEGLDVHGAEFVRLTEREILDFVELEAGELGEEAAGGDVDGDGVGRHEERFGEFDVVGVTTARAVRLHDAVGVDDIEARGIGESSDIGDALIEAFLVESATIPNDTHKVLHGDRHARAAVILEDGNVEPLVAVENRLVDFRGLERFSLRKSGFAEVLFFVRGHNDSAGLLCGGFDPGTFIAAAPVVACVVEDGDFFRASVFAGVD